MQYGEIGSGNWEAGVVYKYRTGITNTGPSRQDLQYAVAMVVLSVFNTQATYDEIYSYLMDSLGADGDRDTGKTPLGSTWVQIMVSKTTYVCVAILGADMCNTVVHFLSGEPVTRRRTET